MYPEITLGPLTLHTFGLSMGLAFVLAYELVRRGLELRGFNGDDAAWLTGAAVVGGLTGSKINYLLTNPPEGGMTLGDALSGNGLTWYGGFLLSAGLVLLVGRMRGIRMNAVADASAPALAVGHAIGRIGCLLNGDDYGSPSDLPWAMTYADGSPATTVASLSSAYGIDLAGPADRLVSVHPSMLYEALPLFAVAAALWVLRRRWLDAPLRSFGTWAICAGAVRWLVELTRLNDDLALGMTLAQWISVGLIVAGSALVAMSLRRRSAEALPAPATSEAPA